jgi:AcrR family transcriptional regulator
VTRRDPTKRARLVDAATTLIHQKGFANTSIADIAHEADVPVGNVYYYFKTKQALGQAVIDRYRAGWQSLLRRWETVDDPRARIEAFIDALAGGAVLMARSGCPIGTLSTELNKNDPRDDTGPLGQQASHLFTDMLAWLEQQFRHLVDADEVAPLAAHVVAAIQGASVLTHSFHTDGYVANEVAMLHDWLRRL